MAEQHVKGPGEELHGRDDVQTGYAWIGSRLKEVSYTVVEGQAVVEGCIVLGSDAEIRRLTETASVQREQEVEVLGAGIESPWYRWPNKIIPYEIRDDLPNPERVHQAIEHWRGKDTGLRFVERTADNATTFDNYITFRPGRGCSSAVGCQRGQQFVTLGGECSRGNVIHEIGHAVGLWHEQSREDRASHIDIRLEKVAEGARHNFDQHIKDGVDLGDYDYGSIMHYPRDAFSIDGSDTIVPKRAGVVIGQREELSDGDVAAVRALYP